MGWSPEDTLQQHESWPSHSHAHQATSHMLRDPVIDKATMRGAVTQALQRQPTKPPENPMKPGAKLQRDAVDRTAAQMAHRKLIMLAYTEKITNCIAREHMMPFEIGGLRFRVLDAFRAQGATSLGQVISSPPGPSGGPYMTHLLPGGNLPWVHGARSPVPARLPHSPVSASLSNCGCRLFRTTPPP